MSKLFLCLILSLLTSAAMAQTKTFKLVDGVYRDDFPFHRGCGFLEVSNGGTFLYYELRERCSDEKGKNIIYRVKPTFNGSTIYIGDVVWDLIKVTDRSIVGFWKGPTPGWVAKVPFRKVE